MSENVLPVAEHSVQIKTAIRDNPVVIIVGETGSGKSTVVPRLMLDEGYNLVVTQPRRLAARTVASRVAKLHGTPLGEVIGYRTAEDRLDSKETRCLFVTDGLAMVRELMGVGNHSLLIIDEVHEWNLNIDMLVAWAELQIKNNANFKLVLMSATLEADRLSAYFNDAPVVNVPGRLFPVEEQSPQHSTMEEDVAHLLRQGRNVLVFQAGKKEIGETIDYLQRLSDLNAEVLSLHGELSSEEQARCFRAYNRPKCVVSTNVAQTSVTIPDIDAVVDSGMERRIELENGIEGLYLKPISLASAEQRKGRAGRTKKGVYVDWCPASDRPDFPVAEILRLRLDQVVLRLAEAGIDMEELRFFHQPDMDKIHEARRTLVALGCMDSEGRVTRIGRRVAKMPISVKYGRMIVEAEGLDVVGDVLTIAAILEQGGVNARVCARCKEYDLKSCDCWRRLVADERTSDVLAQLALYGAAESMNNQEMRTSGIFPKAFHQVKEKRRQLVKALRGVISDQDSDGDRQKILRAVCAGMVDHLYQRSYGYLMNGDDQPRQLARESVVGVAPWVVGEPMDLQIKARYGLKTLRLVRMATKVEVGDLLELAPHLTEITTGLNLRYDYGLEEVVSTTETRFNGQLVKSEEIPHPDHPEASQLRGRVWRPTPPPARTNEVAVEELSQLSERAKFLRDQVNDMIVDRQKKLNDYWYTQLDELDVDNEELPSSRYGLTVWIGDAERTLARVNEFVKTVVDREPEPVSEDALAELATRFNRR